MTATIALRLCLVLGWISDAGCVIASIAFESAVPEPLQAWVGSQASLSGMPEHLMLPLFTFILLWFFISSAGLFLLRRWAAWSFLVLLLAMLPLTMFEGISVQGGIENVLDDLANYSFGMAIALAFFTDALKRKPDEVL